MDAGRPEPRVLVGRTPGAHSARTARRIAKLDSPQANRNSCPSENVPLRSASRRTGRMVLLGPPPGCEFLEARCDAAWQGPRGRRSSRVHVRRDNALILSGSQASRVHLHTLRFRGALDLQCRRHQPATDDVDGRTRIAPAHNGRQTASQSCSTPRAKARPTCISCFPEQARSVRLTTDPAEELEANWSRDGQSIYFGSNRSGRFEIWKMRRDGSGATQVTKNGGQTAQESPDRRSLYYAKNGSPTTIWRLSLDVGPEVVTMCSSWTA